MGEHREKAVIASVHSGGFRPIERTKPFFSISQAHVERLPFLLGDRDVTLRTSRWHGFSVPGQLRIIEWRARPAQRRLLWIAPATHQNTSFLRRVAKAKCRPGCGTIPARFGSLSRANQKWRVV
jgi:hypothetical protein